MRRVLLIKECYAEPMTAQQYFETFGIVIDSSKGDEGMLVISKKDTAWYSMEEFEENFTFSIKPVAEVRRYSNK